ncbi:melanoma inhibitory activity protein 2-like [Cavia porcellus]|uniref:melanoma inhibitory activity protein 2-like n=1 Tax=Cavia porcellus TaxID=10141 RepID=UPI002FE0B43C
MAETANRIGSLAEELTSVTSEIANMKFALWNMGKERLQREMTVALSENAQLPESHSQLSQEAQRGKERGAEVKSQLENGPVSGHQPVSLEKPVYGARLNASLKTTEEQRNQLCTQLWEAENTEKELKKSLYSLQTQKTSLESATAQLQGEHQKLEQKVRVMGEVHHQTVPPSHTKLRQQARVRAEQGRKLPIREEEVGHTAQELETYRKIAQDMQEEWEKTIRSHQRQLTCMQKEARKNWAAAATAGSLLRELRRGNARTKEILRAMEMKAPHLGQDPDTHGVMKSSARRQHCLRGPSRRGRPGLGRKSAHLSPPTLWEEPLAC